VRRPLYVKPIDRSADSNLYGGVYTLVDTPVCRPSSQTSRGTIPNRAASPAAPAESRATVVAIGTYRSSWMDVSNCFVACSQDCKGHTSQRARSMSLQLTVSAGVAGDELQQGVSIKW